MDGPRKGLRRDDGEIFDVIVIGSGAGGLTAAVTAGLNGLDVVVLEKAHVFGGTTAISGGGVWIPCNHVVELAGISDSYDAAWTYFKQCTGNRFDAARVSAFLENGPKMVRFLEQQTVVKFRPSNITRPDYHPDFPGASRGRSLTPLSFDGRLLGREIARLRPPADLLTLMGMMIKPGPDLLHFLNVFRSFRSARFVARRLVSHARDMAIHGRGMDLSNGNALAARLAKSAFDLGIQIRTSVAAKELIKDHGRVTGVRADNVQGGGYLRARRGIVLACGGFSHDVERRRQLYAHAPTGHEHWSPAPETNTGDGLRMGETMNAELKADFSDAAGWSPVSLVPRGEGKFDVFPHLIDRQKPGFIAVNRRGARFVNEANSYHQFCQGLLKACQNEAEVCCFLVADHRTIRRYGMGAVKPKPFPLGRHIRSGYLIRGATIGELAQRVRIERAPFEKTVEEFNTHARQGRDPQFGRGDNIYNRFLGDPDHHPNPCVAPVEHAPFYAMKIVMGELGTFAGLSTDAHARVLDRNGDPIPGLYAAGNDVAHIMAGDYMAGGSMLGPGMTFGYIAGCHLANVSAADMRSEQNNHISRH